MKVLQSSICEVLVALSVVRTLSKRDGEREREREREREERELSKSVCVVLKHQSHHTKVKF